MRVRFCFSENERFLLFYRNLLRFNYIGVWLVVKILILLCDLRVSASLREIFFLEVRQEEYLSPSCYRSNWKAKIAKNAKGE